MSRAFSGDALVVLMTRSKKSPGAVTLRRRVPKRYASVEPRKEIWLSIDAFSAAEGQHKAELAWQEHIRAWEAMLAGDTTVAEDRLAAAREIALTCHGIFPPSATRVRPKEGTDDEANDTERRADHLHLAGAGSTYMSTARSALTFAASMGCRKARSMPGKRSIPG